MSLMWGDASFTYILMRIGGCQARGHVCEYGRMRVKMFQLCTLNMV